MVIVIGHRMRNSATRRQDRIKHFHKNLFKIILYWKRLARGTAQLE